MSSGGLPQTSPMLESNPTRLRARSCLVVLLTLLAGACSQDNETAATTDWQVATRADLSETQTALLDRFVDARNELASSLFAELSGAIKASGHADAIGVCQERAPAIAEEVGAAHNVRIGRTSARLRNPSNGAPTWAAGLIDAEANEQFEARGGDHLRALFPIVIAPPCMACHGPADGLAGGVAAALSERYASDQATGYAQGDLRGWFWVESNPE